MRMSMTLLAFGLAVAVQAQNSPVTINIDASANRHAIDPQNALRPPLVSQGRALVYSILVQFQ